MLLRVEPNSPETVSQVDDRSEWLAWALDEFPRVVMGLTPEERQVVIGFFFDDQTVEDLAATLGLPADRVEAALQTGCSALRANLKP